MIESVFLHEFKQANGVKLTDKHILFRKPLELYNLETDETISFKNMEKAYEHQIGDMTIREIISKASIDLFSMQLDGGRGASSGGKKQFRFSNAGGNDKDNTTPDLPARLNVRLSIKNKSPEGMLKEFAKLHSKSGREYGVTVDENGYVTRYVKGNTTSVGIWGSRGEMVYHNHPNGGNFSKNDMLSTAHSAEKGIVASGRNGDYIFVKGGHFKANAFAKAVNSARPSGNSYDDAIDKWLKKNQKKYGYTYSFRKEKR